MEVLGVILLAGVAGSAIWWFFVRKPNKKVAQQAPAPVDQPATGPVTDSDRPDSQIN